MTPEGRLAAEPILIEASASMKGPLLMQGAIRALQACQPYAMLPADRYGEWKVIDLSFTPQDFSASLRPRTSRRLSEAVQAIAFLRQSGTPRGRPAHWIEERNITMKVTQHLWFEKDMAAESGFYTSLVRGFVGPLDLPQCLSIPQRPG